MSTNTTGGSALRARAAAANGQPGTEVTTAPRQDIAAAPLRVQVERLEDEFKKAMPAGEAVQFVRDAMTCLQTIKNLDRCEPRSVLGSLMNCAQLGLRPGLLGHAWPLPFWDRNVQLPGSDRRGGFKAQLIIGYQGYTHLAYESSRVTAVKSAVVREEDAFDWDEGGTEPPVHRRPKFGRLRGPIVGYYATVTTTLGGTLVYAMDVPEMIAFRDAHAPRGKPRGEGESGPIVGPWAGDLESDNFIGMARKTVLRYALKTAPKSAQLARAEAVDGTVRVDASVLSEPAAVSQVAELPAAPQQSIAGPSTPAQGIVIPRDQQTADEYDPTAEPGWGGGK
jgi:recombination protein RecT